MQRFGGVKGSGCEWHSIKRDLGNIDQPMTIALAGTALGVIGCRCRHRVLSQQVADQGGAIFRRAALQAIRIAAEYQTTELKH
ncbi:hypothetical protein KJ068_07180 [bacterium]|nr:hypothetical protein [bacterium]